MKFNRRARLDTSQVEDRRGRRGKAAAGGVAGAGGIGAIILIIMQLFGGGGSGGGFDLSSLGGGAPQGQQQQAPEGGFDVQAECVTGADANEHEICRHLATINSIQNYWIETFDAADLDYEVTRTVFFTDAVQTGGCGSASSAVGPFYCPADRLVYMDLGFFDELVRRFGASGGDFAEAYIMGHEYGHHVQNLLGISRRASREAGADGDAVRLELQADCLAGAWAHHATTIPDASGQPFILQLTREDIRNALSAAGAVGDDRIQEQARGHSDPHTYTHGTSEQRQRWFMVGYDTGDVNACDTFATNDL